MQLRIFVVLCKLYIKWKQYDSTKEEKIPIEKPSDSLPIIVFHKLVDSIACEHAYL